MRDVLKLPRLRRILLPGVLILKKKKKSTAVYCVFVFAQGHISRSDPEFRRSSGMFLGVVYHRVTRPCTDIGRVSPDNNRLVNDLNDAF